MNDRTTDNAQAEVMELIIEHGFGGMEAAFSILFNEAMKIERSRVLQADPYQRTDQRLGYANGYKPKHVKSRLGATWICRFRRYAVRWTSIPSALEKGERSERALKLAMAEMYIKGISTVKCPKCLRSCAGFSSALPMSAVRVSRWIRNSNAGAIVLWGKWNTLSLMRVMSMSE